MRHYLDLKNFNIEGFSSFGYFGMLSHYDSDIYGLNRYQMTVF